MYLHEDLHAASQPQNQVQSGLLLDVVVRKSAAILKLLASKDQALLSGGMQKKTVSRFFRSRFRRRKDARNWEWAEELHFQGIYIRSS